MDSTKAVITGIICRLSRRLPAGSDRYSGTTEIAEIHQALTKFGQQMGRGTLRSKLDELESEGKVMTVRAKKFWYRATASERMTYADMLEVAETFVESQKSKGERASLGRRTACDRNRAVEHISRRQWTRIRTALRKVARAYMPDAPLEDAMGANALSLFRWEPEASRPGGGDWTLAVQATERASSPKSKNEDVGAVRLLGDLLATYGYLPRTRAHDQSHSPVPENWLRVHEAWREILRDGGISRAPSVAMILLKGLRIAYPDLEDPASLDADAWARLQDTVEDYMVREEWDRSARSQVRKGVGVLGDAGVIQAERWAGYQKVQAKAYGMIPRSHRDVLGRAYGSDFAATSSNEKRRAALAGVSDRLARLKDPDERYGLHRLLLHFTLPPSRLPDSIPDRKSFPRKHHRKLANSSGRSWRSNTVGYNIEILSWVLGWMERHRGIDLPTANLRVLADVDVMRALFDWHLEEGTSPDRLARVYKLLARITSPYLESLALEDGDEELADRAAEASSACSANGIVTSKTGSNRASYQARVTEGRPAGQDVRSERRRAQACEQALLATGLADGGHQVLVEVYRHARAALLEDLQRDSPADLLEVDARDLTRKDRQAVRDLIYFQDSLLVPLRAKTARMALSDMRQIEEDGSYTAEYPAGLFKREEVGEGRFCYRRATSTIWCPHLYDLYLREAGVRELELRARGIKSPCFLVPAGAREKPTEVMDVLRSEVVPGARYTHLVHGIGRVVRRAGRSHDLEALKNSGVLCTHMFRYAVATAICQKGRIEDAALILHHSGVDMIRRIYSAREGTDAFDLLDPGVDDDGTPEK